MQMDYICLDIGEFDEKKYTVLFFMAHYSCFFPDLMQSKLV